MDARNGEAIQPGGNAVAQSVARNKPARNALQGKPLEGAGGRGGGRTPWENCVGEAMANADAVANHLDHVVEHLSSIGCTSKAAVNRYFALESRTLASLYFEAAKAHPSPSELTKLALRNPLDARRPIQATSVVSRSGRSRESGK